MSNMLFARDTEHEQLGKLPRNGQWARWYGRTVIRCPVCGSTPMGDAHLISADGKVSPSFVCTGPGCTFHEFITLADFSVNTSQPTENVNVAPVKGENAN